MIIKGYILTYLYLGLLLFITYILNKYFKVNEIITRKLVHINVSFCYVIFYHYLGNSYHIIIPPLTFILLNYLSYKKNIFKGMENNKETLGTVFYPISVLIMAIISYVVPEFYPYFGIGLFCMAFGDGLAPLIAGYLKSMKIYNNKTLVGTLTVFIISIVVVILFNQIFTLNMDLFSIILIGVVSSLLELIGINGYDNLYLPLGVSLFSFILGVI